MPFVPLKIIHGVFFFWKNPFFETYPKVLDIGDASLEVDSMGAQCAPVAAQMHG